VDQLGSVKRTCAKRERRSKRWWVSNLIVVVHVTTEDYGQFR
jgi:hypothetical protein